MVVGPPGTGKTDTAVQILNVLYHNCPSQRTLIITHSNQALNDLFEKIMQVWKIINLIYVLNFVHLKDGIQFIPDCLFIQKYGYPWNLHCDISTSN